MLTGDVFQGTRRPASPGQNTQVVFNKQGVDGADANLTYNVANQTLTTVNVIATNISAGNIAVTQNITGGNLSISANAAFGNIQNVNACLVTYNPLLTQYFGAW